MIASSSLRNAGTSPILPSDFHENINVTVESPWMIVAVENKWTLGAKLKWKKISDTRFEAEPTLLNPGDTLYTYIYLTNKQFKQIPTNKEHAEPNIVWSARIVNLRGFTEPPSFLDRYLNLKYIGWGIFIHLSGWAVPFVIITAMLFQALYLYLLARAGLLQTMRLATTILLLLVASLLSFAAAESMATYLFPDVLIRMQGIQHEYNAPFIILYWIVLFFLYRKAKLKSI